MELGMELGIGLGVVGAIIIFFISRQADKKFQADKLDAMQRHIARVEKVKQQETNEQQQEP